MCICSIHILYIYIYISLYYKKSIGEGETESERGRKRHGDTPIPSIDLGSQELDLGIGVIRLHKSGWVNLEISSDGVKRFRVNPKPYEP